MASYYYNVCLNRPAARLKSAYTYSYETKISIGTLVQVLFHGRRETGADLSDHDDDGVINHRCFFINLRGAKNYRSL